MSIATTQQPLCEGKTKRFFSTDNPNEVIAVFKDDATAFNAQKHAVIEGKGAINATVSRILFEAIQQAGIPTCYLSQGAEPNQLRYAKLTMIQLEVVVRNRAFGTFCKRYGTPQGQIFANPIVELVHKSNDDPLINDEAILALGLLPDATALRQIKLLALAANEVFIALFDALGIICADFKLEFGWDAEARMVLGDELSPDNFRLRDAKTGEVLDKDVFRLDLGDVGQAYRTLLARLEAGTAKVAATEQAYQAEVFVQSRKNIFSPESKAIQEGLHAMGYSSASNMSAGKRFTFTLNAKSLSEANQQLQALTDALLANPVIEDYEVRVAPASKGEKA